MNTTKGATITLDELAQEDRQRAASRSAAKANAKLRKGH